MSGRTLETYKKWVYGYISSESKKWLTWSDIACDAGNYDDAFLAGRAYQALMNEGKIKQDGGMPILVEEEQGEVKNDE